MAIYRVATPATPPGPDDAKEGVVHVRFAPSEGAAKKFRRELAEQHGFKLAEVEYAVIDLRKGGKAGFIDYLNAYHAQAPGGYKPEGYPKAAKKAKKK